MLAGRGRSSWSAARAFSRSGRYRGGRELSLPCPRWLLHGLTWSNAVQGVCGRVPAEWPERAGFAACRAVVWPPSLGQAGVVSTAADRSQATQSTQVQGSSDDRQVHDSGDDSGGSGQAGDGPVTAPSGYAAVPQPRQGDDDGRGGAVERPQRAVRRTKRRGRSGVPSDVGAGGQRGSGPTPVPSPEEWAREQLRNAPPRSRKWARSVAAIYGLDIRWEE